MRKVKGSQRERERGPRSDSLALTKLALSLVGKPNGFAEFCKGWQNMIDEGSAERGEEYGTWTVSDEECARKIDALLSDRFDHVRFVNGTKRIVQIVDGSMHYRDDSGNWIPVGDSEVEQVDVPVLEGTPKFARKSRKDSILEAEVDSLLLA